MDFSKSILLIVSLSSLLIASNAIRVPKPFSPEILNFCTGSENTNLCGETIAPLFEGGPVDPTKALGAEIEATHNQAKKIADIIKKSLSDPTTDKNALDALGICESQYEDILDITKEAQKLIEKQNVVDAYYKFSAVISDQSTCEDAFAESPGVNNPFAEDSKVLFQLGGNALAVMDGIVNHGKEV